MSDVIRMYNQMTGRSQSPMGLGNNPAPFPIARPDRAMADPRMQDQSMARLQGLFGDQIKSDYDRDMEQMVGKLRGRYMTDIDMPGHPNGWRQQ